MKTVMSLALLLAFPAFAEGPHWTYSGHGGPSHWAELEKEFETCAIGKEQSPINIHSSKAVKANLPKIEFRYQPSALSVVNNGHTIQANYDSGSSIKVGDDVYDLIQFHFHAPSEEKVNGKAHEMVAHLVHKNAEGKLAVVAVLLDKGAENAGLKPVFASLPQKAGETRQDGAVHVNAADLLPKDHTYYTFKGSLTTPPCSQDVRWFVLKHATTLSAAEAKAFRRLYPMNARPIQPLNGRKVEVGGT